MLVDSTMPAKTYNLAVKLALSAVAVALGWPGTGIMPLSWGMAFLCATFPPIWSRQSPVRRRICAALCGIGVALFIYVCTGGIVLGLMTWSHEAAQTGALVLQLFMIVAAYWVSRQVLGGARNQITAGTLN